MGSLCLLQDTDLDNIFSGEALNTKVLFQIKVDLTLIKVSQISTLVMSCHVFFTNGNTDGDTNVDTAGVESSVGWILWNLKNILVPV